MDYINAVGRRKTSVARVYLKPGGGEISVNGRTLESYFPLENLRDFVHQPFILTETEGNYDVKVTIYGGGIRGQAEAIRLGIARALVKIDEENKPKMKADGLMTRDPRMVERKKPGQKKARKSFQFSKR